MKKQASIEICGLVQGVCFRYCAKEKALELGISGWVKNEADGKVRIEAEGEEEDLNKFISWCKNGSESAVVESVDCAISNYLKNFNSFEIKK